MVQGRVLYLKILLEKMIYSLRWYFLVATVFLFIFSVPLPIIGNSSFIGIFLAATLLFMDSRIINSFIILLKDKYIFYSLLSLILFLVLALVSPFLHKTFDFSIVPTLLNNLVSLIACLIFAISVNIWGRTKDMSDLLVAVFFIQVFFIILMLLSADLRELIQGVIRSEGQLDRMKTYNNVRGLGLSGFIAFGLAISMGTLGFILCFWINKNKGVISPITAFLLFNITLLASLSAGRTAILGFALGLIFFLVNSKVLAYAKMFIRQILLTVVILGAALTYILNDELLSQIAFFYSRYVFRFVWNYFESGTILDSSVTALVQDMYFLPYSVYTFLFGDGIYTNSDATYYMHTDAGYMRFMLFFGIAGSAFVYISYLFLSIFIIRRVKRLDKSISLAIVFMVLMAFIFHYKGETIFFSVPFNKIFFCFCFFYLIKTRCETNY